MWLHVDSRRVHMLQALEVALGAPRVLMLELAERVAAGTLLRATPGAPQPESLLEKDRVFESGKQYLLGMEVRVLMLERAGCVAAETLLRATPGALQPDMSSHHG